MGAYNDIRDFVGSHRLGRSHTLFLRCTPFERKRKRYSPDDQKEFQTLPRREPTLLRIGVPCRHTFICRLFVEKTLVQFPTKNARRIIHTQKQTYPLCACPTITGEIIAQMQRECTSALGKLYKTIHRVCQTEMSAQ